MADYYDTGTVTVLSGNRTVTGAGTSWAGLIRGGDTLEIGGRQMRVASVESATSLTLKLPAAAAASGAYAIWYNGPSRSTGLQALDDMRRLIEAAEILMAQRGDYAVRAAPLNAPPAAPVTGDLYIIDTAPAGVWAGYAGYLARWTGTGWAYIAPQPGMRAYVIGAGINWQRGEAAWGIVPGVVSALGVSGNISDAQGSVFPRGLTVNGPVLSQGNAFALQTEANAHFWFRNVDGTRLHGLLFYNFSPGSMCMRTYIDGGPTFHELAVLPDGQVNLPNVVPNSATRAVNKAYVDAQIATQFTSAAAWDAVGSTILARNANAAATSAGNTVAGSSLRPARIMWSGSPASHSSYLTTGTWRLCGAPHNANDDDICLYRRIA